MSNENFILDLNTFKKGSKFYDLIFDCANKNINYHIYLYNCFSGEPNIYINNVLIKPLLKTNNYVYYGKHKFSLPESFFLIKVDFFKDIDLSKLIIANKEVLFNDDLEKELFGIKSDLGISILNPNTVKVGAKTIFTYSFIAKTTVNKDTYFKVTIPYLFDEPKEDINLECFINSKKINLYSFERKRDGHEKYSLVYRLNDYLLKNDIITIKYKTDSMYLFPLEFKTNKNNLWYDNIVPFSTSFSVDNINYLPIKNTHSFEITRDAIHKLKITGPSQIKVGNNIIYKMVWFDEYDNPVIMDNTSGFKLVLRKEEKTVLKVEKTVTFKDGLAFISIPIKTPGVYNLCCYFEDNLIAISNPLNLLPKTSDLPNIYFGDIHCHSSYSDGIGDFKDGYEYAKKYSCLDFVSMSEHAEYFTDNMWEEMKQITNEYNSNDLVTLVGYEWAGNQVHRNIYTSRDDLKVLRGKRIESSDIRSLYELYANDEEVVMGAHGTISHGMVSDMYDERVERFIEIYSMWGSSEGIDSLLEPNYISRRPKTVNQLIKEGYKVGFTGGGDNHNARPGFTGGKDNNNARRGFLPSIIKSLTQFKDLKHQCGLTACLANELSRTSIISSLRNRNTYATTGARIILNIDVKPNIIKIDVIFEGLPNKVEIIADGNIIETYETRDLINQFTYQISETYSYIYVRAVQYDLEVAYSSPYYF